MQSTIEAALVRSRIKEFLQSYNGTRIHLRGDDLKRMGLKPGPDFTVILDKILHSKIDGKLKTKKDEIDYARALTARALRKKRR